ncbi:epimerase [Aquiluna sp. KACHI24]|nr:epimerase [Aquiluna sp. KACHI24]
MISGASGLIGTEVARQLKELGHEPVRLTRKKPAAEGEVYWNPAKGELDPAVIETIEAVVNLAGATTGKIPWTKRYMQEIIDSRIDSTRTLVKAINNASNKPKVLVSGSASGFYGDCADEWLSEESPKGTGFLSDLAARWEEEAKKANTRVVLVRTTLVMSKKLGALGKLLPIMKFGLGGALGTGKQWWAWISLEDEARAIIHLIQNEQASGAYNLTAPEPATCEQVIKALAKGLRRPAIFKIPTFLMRTVIGLAAEELLLCSQKMTSHRLQESGFEFKHPTLEKSVGYVLS